MNEKILKLIEEYKRREEWLTKNIVDLEKKKDPNDILQLEMTKNTRVFWRVVIKDLEALIR